MSSQRRATKRRTTDDEVARTLYRQWALLQRIPRAPRKVSSSQLLDALEARGMKTTLRTIQRDLIKLASVFPLDADEHRPQGWCFRSSVAPVLMPGMDPLAALALVVLDGAAERTVPRAMLGGIKDHIEQARGVLSASGLEKSWLQKVRSVGRSLPMAAPKVRDDVVTSVHDALLEGRRLALRYQGRAAGKGARERYEVDPVALVHRDALSYLVAQCSDGDVKHFALHRCLSAEVLDQPGMQLSGDAREAEIARVAWGIQVSKEPLALQVAFNPDATRTVVESPWAKDQEELRTRQDGWTVFRMTVPDTLLVRSWILSFGDAVEVLAPKSLRGELRQKHAAAAARHA
ncbi:MAG: WYL domain-containing protein [Deltaproteobacteria bacterium]|nr:WYL domain-containing protein [Deltaproteobacteria bacterium]